jgi:chitosanase
MLVPCARCEEFTERFKDAKFDVLGCTPDAKQAGMCILSFQLKAESHATVTLAVNALAASTVAAPVPPADITPTQANTARAIVNIFETSTVLGEYGQVTVLKSDTGRLTYGRSQTTLGSGNLTKLLNLYCANQGARFGAKLTSLLPAFAAKEMSLDTDIRVHNLLRACADDPVMRETQDVFFNEAYWTPAVAEAKKLGLQSPLAIAVVYDSHIHGSWELLRDRTLAGIDAPSTERAWVQTYVERRRDWLANHENPALNPTVYRMDAFLRLIDENKWGLPLPLVVRGAEISAESLAGVPPSSYEGPQPGTRTISVSQPLARGLDVRLVQLGLSDRGVSIVADGIFGTTSSARLREYQIANALPASGVADLALIAKLTS